jgi:hypothetical protein
MLIAGAGMELVSALAEEAEKRNIKTARALIQSRNGAGRFTHAAAAEKTASLDWNPGSPISARSLILAAENKVGHLSGGIIVCTAPDNAEASDFSPAGIDIIVNNHIKSYMLLANELSRHFRARQSGSLALVLFEKPVSGILAAPIFSSFKSFSGSLLAHSNPEYIRTTAFSCEEKIPPPVNEFAAYVFKTLSENKKLDGAKWFKFTKLKRNLKLT